MNTIVTYECEICKYRSENKKDVSDCEAKHLGVTPEDIATWRKLKRKVASVNKMAERDTKYINYAQNTLDDLKDFEKKHNLQNKTMPHE